MNYFEVDRISQSYLKRLLRGKFTEEERSPSRFILGTLVDAMLTDPEELDKYMTIEGTSPTAKKGIFAQYIIDNYDGIMSLEKLSEKAYQVAEYKNKSAAAYLDEILKDPWFARMRMISEMQKEPVKKDVYEKAEYVTSSFLTHKHTAHIFEDSNRLDQLEIYFDAIWDDQRFELKAKPDIVISKDGKIYPYDIKTTARATINFYQDIIDYRYDIQALFYQYALKAKFPDMTIMPLQFVVESHVYPGIPLIWNIGSHLNFEKAERDISLALNLDRWYKKNTDVNENIIISSNGGLIMLEDLWVLEPLNSLLDKSIKTQQLEKPYKLSEAQLEISTLDLMNQNMTAFI